MPNQTKYGREELRPIYLLSAMRSLDGISHITEDKDIGNHLTERRNLTTLFGLANRLNRHAQRANLHRRYEHRSAYMQDFTVFTPSRRHRAQCPSPPTDYRKQPEKITSESATKPYRAQYRVPPASRPKSIYHITPTLILQLDL